MMASSSTDGVNVLQLPPPLPPPNGSVLTLLAALSNHSPTPSSTFGNHDNANNANNNDGPPVPKGSNHQLALAARDEALSSSPDGYGNLCVNFCRVLACPSPRLLPEAELRRFRDGDPCAFAECCGWVIDDECPSESAKAHGTRAWNNIRQMAGLLLKNALVSPPLPKDTPLDALGRVLHAPSFGGRGRMELPPHYATEIKLGLLICITDAEAGIRGTASTCIARCCTAAVHLEKSMKAFCIKNWAELIPFILQCITSSSTTTNECASIGALNTLRKLLEDIPNRLVSESPTVSFNELVPSLLHILSLPGSPTHRKEALMCLNSFILPMPGSLVAHMDAYLGCLSTLTSDPDSDVRKLVCRSIVTLLEHRSEYLRPHIGSIASFMLAATSDDNVDVALEACEFWLTCASLDDDDDDGGGASSSSSSIMMDTIVNLFPLLLPQLLKRMVYPLDKIEELMEENQLEEFFSGNNNNNNRQDRDQDLAPIFHKSHIKGGGIDNSATTNNDDESDIDDIDDDDDMDDDDDNEWTLRKCAAASLDALAGLFGPSVTLPALLPALQEGLGHEDQWVREASILALGAIADGCAEELTPHLPLLHPFLLRQLTNPESIPQLRCISAWTLARYANWTVDMLLESNSNCTGGGDPTLVGQVAEAIALRLLDTNKKVQIAMCSAMGVFAEAVGDHLTPYLEPIYGIFVQALHRYSTRSMLVLFDTLGVMADNVGSGVGQGSIPGLYIPVLLQLWNDTAMNNPFDRTLLPLMECLGSSTVVCGLNYQPYALQTFEMAMSTIDACTIILSHEDDLGDVDEEMTDPIICSIDLIDGLVEGLGPNFVSLVNGSAKFGPTFTNVLMEVTGHFVTGVRMSGFALLGDLARQAPVLIEPGLSNLLTEAISSIDPNHSAMCNNAVWALGEVCVRCRDNPAPLALHADNLLSSLIPLLMGDAVDIDGNPLSLPGIKENAATTMGRLAMVNPNFVAPDLGRFLLGWCDGMSKISDANERHDAFGGFVLALRANPQSVNATGQDVDGVLTAIVFSIFSWHLPSGHMPDNLLSGSSNFEPFPAAFGELLASLRQLLHDLKTGAGDAWTKIDAEMPQKVKTLFKEVYHV